MDDQRRRQGDDVAGRAHEDAAVEGLDEARVRAPAGFVREGLELDGADETDVADVDDVRQAAQGMHCLLPIRRQLRGARQQALLLQRVEGRDGRGAGQRMAGIRIAVEQLDHRLGAGHERVVDARLHKDRPHRHGAVGDAFGGGDHVRRDAEVVGAERRAQPAECGNDLIEDEQDIVLGADGGQALQVTARRNEDAGRARDGLDDDGGDGRGIVQGDQPFQIVGQLGAVLRLAAAEGIARRIMRVPQMIDAGNERAEHAPVGGDAADGRAAEVRAMVSALAADEARLAAVAPGAMVGERQFQRRVDRLRARVGEEDVVEAGRRDVDQARRTLERLRVPHLEYAGKVERTGLLADRLDDLRPAVPGVDAP